MDHDVFSFLVIAAFASLTFTLFLFDFCFVLRVLFCLSVYFSALLSDSLVHSLVISLRDVSPHESEQYIVFLREISCCCCSPFFSKVKTSCSSLKVPSNDSLDIVVYFSKPDENFNLP